MPKLHSRVQWCIEETRKFYIFCILGVDKHHFRDLPVRAMNFFQYFSSKRHSFPRWDIEEPFCKQAVNFEWEGATFALSRGLSMRSLKNITENLGKEGGVFRFSWLVYERNFSIHRNFCPLPWLVYEETFENGGKSTPNCPTGEWGAFHKNTERSWCRMNA